MQVGSKVTITAPADSDLVTVAKWWPKGEVTGTIQKLFKNGAAAVAIDQIGNRSDDNKKTMNLPLSWMRPRCESCSCNSRRCLLSDGHSNSCQFSQGVK